MVIYVYTDTEDGKITGWSSTYAKGAHHIILEESDSFVEDNPFNYKLVEGKLIKWRTEKEILEEQKKQEEEEIKREQTPTPEERIEMLEQAILFLSME